MVEKRVYASAQIIAQNPILKEKKLVQYQYYRYLRKLVQMVGWEEETYTKEQLYYYRSVLCGNINFEGEKFRNIRNFIWLLPFDLAAIVGYSKKKIHSSRMKDAFDECARYFNLKKREQALLSVEILAALGNEESWDILFREEKLKRFLEYLQYVKQNISFIDQEPYTLLITATMSAGKSTLINALAGKYISRMQNMACTSKIHTVLSKAFEDNTIVSCGSRLCLNTAIEDLMDLDPENTTSKIWIGTFFQGGRLAGKRLAVLDSPGVNSSENKDHTELSEAEIQAKKYDVMLYVMNATQLGTNDDQEHLEFVARTIGRKKLIFVMNKIDSLITEDEDLLSVLESQKNYLESKGFQRVKIYPVSARAAYLAKKSKVEELRRTERRELENFMDKFEAADLPSYYEKKLSCTVIPACEDEADTLLRNCGFSYLEMMIENLCSNDDKGESIS